MYKIIQKISAELYDKAFKNNPEQEEGLIYLTDLTITEMGEMAEGLNWNYIHGIICKTYLK